METTIIRIVAQVALVGWCVAASIALLASRGKVVHAAGHGWAWLGLACFAVWMFMSALSNKDAALFPRSSALWLFAIFEVGTAGGAWGWLAVYVRHNFRVHVRVSMPHLF